MTVRYVAGVRPTAGWWDANGTDYLARTVIETETRAIDSGLVDKNGTKLYRIEDRPPVGFIRPKG